jgi:hypothetical protein
VIGSPMQLRQPDEEVPHDLDYVGRVFCDRNGHRVRSSGGPRLWSWLAEPGVLLASPIYVLVGGVHGGFTKLWWQSIALCNGLAYAAIIATTLWARRYIQRKRA